MNAEMMKGLNNYFNHPKNQERAAKLSLIGIFLALLTAFTSRRTRNGKAKRDFELKPFDLALLGIATFRLGRLVSFDQVAEPLRKPFTQTVPDPTGAGETVEPRGEGVQKTIGQLISCPICSGTWIAAALVYGLHSLPNPTRIFLAIMSSTGIAEMLNALTEALSWTGQAARKKSGKPKPQMRPPVKKMYKPFVIHKEDINHVRDYPQYYRQSKRGNGF